MKSRFLFPHAYKKYGIFFSIPFAILGCLIMFNHFYFKWLVLPLPKSLNFLSNATLSENENGVHVLNLNNDIAIIGFLVSLMLIAFSKVKTEDEYVSQIRLESLQWAMYINVTLLILATIFIHDFAYYDVTIYNMFTPLLIFIIRFHYLLHFQEKK